MAKATGCFRTTDVRVRSLDMAEGEAAIEALARGTWLCPDIIPAAPAIENTDSRAPHADTCLKGAPQQSCLASPGWTALAQRRQGLAQLRSHRRSGELPAILRNRPRPSGPVLNAPAPADADTSQGGESGGCLSGRSAAPL